MRTLPIINIESLIKMDSNATKVSMEIGNACKEFGFFYITGHSIDVELQNKLELLSTSFFNLDLDEKMKIEMLKGGKAWRGYFPVGNELTSNLPDQKEGIYFGKELNPDNPLVQENTPLHGKNLFPSEIKAFKETVLEYIMAIEKLGHALMRGLSMSLGLDSNYISDNYTREPLTLFRIFNYPNSLKKVESDNLWGVGEHTDYGVLTILKQDMNGGLQVKSNEEWIEAPPIANSFICNIGDMLEKMTKGLYISTPHRVKNNSNKNRLSFPFFFDPNYFSEVKPLPIKNSAFQKKSEDKRWDSLNIHSFNGTYGDYILSKISKVFPNLFDKIE